MEGPNEDHLQVKRESEISNLQKYSVSQRSISHALGDDSGGDKLAAMRAKQPIVIDHKFLEDHDNQEMIASKQDSS